MPHDDDDLPFAGGFNPLVRRSAPVGAVATAYAATRPHASAHGFTDASFQPTFMLNAEGRLDGKSAALLAGWASKVNTASCCFACT